MVLEPKQTNLGVTNMRPILTKWIDLNNLQKLNDFDIAIEFSDAPLYADIRRYRKFIRKISGDKTVNTHMIQTSSMLNITGAMVIFGLS